MYFLELFVNRPEKNLAKRLGTVEFRNRTKSNHSETLYKYGCSIAFDFGTQSNFMEGSKRSLEMDKIFVSLRR